jgi:hypothetical protein
MDQSVQIVTYSKDAISMAVKATPLTDQQRV